MVSVIVPIYNVANYLPECIESLLAQTYNDIEILLVDDGSTDGSGEIADRYAERDDRIHVYHQPNGGISAARNRGLDEMHGDYVMFVDGDDYVSKDFCKAAWDLITEHHVDIASFGYYVCSERGDEVEIKVTTTPGILNKEEAIKELIRRRDVMSNYAWNKIFKREVFNSLRFPEGLTFEDVAIMHRVYDRSSSGIYLSDRALYFYRKDRPGNIMSSIRSPRAIHDRMIGEIERLEFVKTHYPKIEIDQYGPLVEVCFQGLTLLPFNHEDRKVIKAFLDSNKEKCLSATYGERRRRLNAYYYMKPLFYLASLYVKKHYYPNN